MSYQHLTQEERYQIYAHKQTGKSPSEIGNLLGRNKSTIHREFTRNKGEKGYRPNQAHKFANDRHKTKDKFIKLTDTTIALINKFLVLDWSPEQISGCLLRDYNIKISHETIYQYILRDKANGSILYKHLRCQKKNRKRYGTKSHDRRGQIKDRVFIEQRPQIVEDKTFKGDWEGDLVIGKNQRFRATLNLFMIKYIINF